MGGLWYLTLLIAILLVLAGELIQYSSPARITAWSIPIQALGLTVLVVCGRELVATGVLKNMPDVRVSFPSIGPAILITIPLFLGLLTGGPFGIFLIGFSFLVVLLLAVSPVLRARLSTIYPTAPEALPPVPTLHIAFTSGTAVTLWGFLLTVMRIDIGEVAFVAAIGLSTVVTWLLLGSIPDRRAARQHVIVAVLLTAVSLTVGLLSEGVSIDTTPLDEGVLIATLFAGACTAVSWGIVFTTLIDVSETISNRFDGSGRRADTDLAAIFAYLSICGSSLLLTSAIAFFLGSGWILTQISPDKVPLFLAAAVSFGVPVWYYIGGVGYQLYGTIRSIQCLRQSDQQSHLPDLPLDPRYPVRVLEMDGFFAAAYADPFVEHVVLSYATVDTLDPEALAVVIAHEESHIKYRGALLQIVFAVVPLTGLMGKNVVYSLYDFMERERTADSTAIDRASDAGFDGAAALRRALDEADDMPLSELSVATFLPTAVTVPEQLRPSGLVGRLYGTFFGAFAGQAHPPTDERRSALRQQ